jgi:magnesium transporter
MLNAYRLTAQGLERSTVRARDELTADVLWLDMLSPTEIERGWVQETYDHQVHYLDELSEIEASARFFRDQHGDHVRLYFLELEEAQARNVDVGFTLQGNRLYSLRAREVSALRAFHTEVDALSRPPTDALSILFGIEELRIALLADIFERLHTELEGVSDRIFAGPDHDMERMLRELGRMEDINGKARLGTLENRRAMQAFATFGQSKVNRELVDVLVRDVDSLMSHCEYLFQKIDFLMDSALGMIDIAHARRLSIFTVLSVVLMPPTLIASIYGMNFRHMPELEWTFGYPMALALMFAVAVGPILYLRYKRWL